MSYLSKGAIYTTRIVQLRCVMLNQIFYLLLSIKSIFLSAFISNERNGISRRFAVINDTGSRACRVADNDVIVEIFNYW